MCEGYFWQKNKFHSDPQKSIYRLKLEETLEYQHLYVDLSHLLFFLCCFLDLIIIDTIKAMMVLPFCYIIALQLIIFLTIRHTICQLCLRFQLFLQYLFFLSPHNSTTLDFSLRQLTIKPFLKPIHHLSSIFYNRTSFVMHYIDLETNRYLKS